MTDQDRNEIIAEIIRLTGREVRQPGDIMAAELAETVGITEPTARRDLNLLVEQGKATTRRVYDPDRGQQVRVWRLVKP